MILIDHQEPASIENSFLIQKSNIQLKRESLEVGDYLIRTRGYEIPCERKSPEDFVSSIIDGRLNNQLFHLSKKYFLSFLIITGPFSKLIFEGRIPRKTLISTKLNIICKHAIVYDFADFYPSHKKGGKVYLVELDSEFDVPIFLTTLHEKVEKGVFDRLPSRPVGKKQTKEDMLLLMYQCLPNSGIETSKNLFTKFPSFQQLFSATIKDLKTVDGIGDKRAKDIFEFLHS